MSIIANKIMKTLCTFRFRIAAVIFQEGRELTGGVKQVILL